jgi:hypothetical protein
LERFHFVIEEDYVVDERDVPVSVCVIVSSGTLFTPVNITLTAVDGSILVLQYMSVLLEICLLKTV